MDRPIDLPTVPILENLMVNFIALQSVPLYFFGIADKYNKKWKKEPRVVIVTQDALYTAKKGGDISRCINLSFIAELYVNSRERQLAVKAPREDQYDLCVQTKDFEKLAHVLSVLCKHISGKELPVRYLSTADRVGSQRYPLKLQKPPKYKLELRPEESQRQETVAADTPRGQPARTPQLGAAVPSTEQHPSAKRIPSAAASRGGSGGLINPPTIERDTPTPLGTAATSLRQPSETSLRDRAGQKPPPQSQSQPQQPQPHPPWGDAKLRFDSTPTVPPPASFDREPPSQAAPARQQPPPSLPPPPPQQHLQASPMDEGSAVRAMPRAFEPPLGTVLGAADPSVVSIYGPSGASGDAGQVHASLDLPAGAHPGYGNTLLHRALPEPVRSAAALLPEYEALSPEHDNRVTVHLPLTGGASTPSGAGGQHYDPYGGSVPSQPGTGGGLSYPGLASSPYTHDQDHHHHQHPPAQHEPMYPPQHPQSHPHPPAKNGIGGPSGEAHAADAAAAPRDGPPTTPMDGAGIAPPYSYSYGAAAAPAEAPAATTTVAPPAPAWIPRLYASASSVSVGGASADDMPHAAAHPSAASSATSNHSGHSRSVTPAAEAAGAFDIGAPAPPLDDRRRVSVDHRVPSVASLASSAGQPVAGTANTPEEVGSSQDTVTPRSASDPAAPSAKYFDDLIAAAKRSIPLPEDKVDTHVLGVPGVLDPMDVHPVDDAPAAPSAAVHPPADTPAAAVALTASREILLPTDTVDVSLEMPAPIPPARAAPQPTTPTRPGAAVSAGEEDPPLPDFLASTSPLSRRAAAERSRASEAEARAQQLLEEFDESMEQLASVDADVPDVPLPAAARDEESQAAAPQRSSSITPYGVPAGATGTPVDTATTAAPRDDSVARTERELDRKISALYDSIAEIQEKASSRADEEDEAASVASTPLYKPAEVPPVVPASLPPVAPPPPPAPATDVFTTPKNAGRPGEVGGDAGDPAAWDRSSPLGKLAAAERQKAMDAELRAARLLHEMTVAAAESTAPGAAGTVPAPPAAAAAAPVDTPPPPARRPQDHTLSLPLPVDALWCHSLGAHGLNQLRLAVTCDVAASIGFPPGQLSVTSIAQGESNKAVVNLSIHPRCPHPEKIYQRFLHLKDGKRLPIPETMRAVRDLGGLQPMREQRMKGASQASQGASTVGSDAAGGGGRSGLTPAALQYYAAQAQAVRGSISNHSPQMPSPLPPQEALVAPPQPAARMPSPPPPPPMAPSERWRGVGDDPAAAPVSHTSTVTDESAHTVDPAVQHLAAAVSILEGAPHPPTATETRARLETRVLDEITSLKHAMLDLTARDSEGRRAADAMKALEVSQLRATLTSEINALKSSFDALAAQGVERERAAGGADAVLVARLSEEFGSLRQVLGAIAKEAPAPIDPRMQQEIAMLTDNVRALEARYKAKEEETAALKQSVTQSASHEHLIQEIERVRRDLRILTEEQTRVGEARDKQTAHNKELLERHLESMKSQLQAVVGEHDLERMRSLRASQDQTHLYTSTISSLESHVVQLHSELRQAQAREAQQSAAMLQAEASHAIAMARNAMPPSPRTAQPPPAPASVVVVPWAPPPPAEPTAVAPAEKKQETTTQTPAEQQAAATQTPVMKQAAETQTPVLAERNVNELRAPSPAVVKPPAPRHPHAPFMRGADVLRMLHERYAVLERELADKNERIRNVVELTAKSRSAREEGEVTALEARLGQIREDAAKARNDVQRTRQQLVAAKEQRLAMHKTAAAVGTPRGGYTASAARHTPRASGGLAGGTPRGRAGVGAGRPPLAAASAPLPAAAAGPQHSDADADAASTVAASEADERILAAAAAASRMPARTASAASAAVSQPSQSQPATDGGGGAPSASLAMAARGGPSVGSSSVPLDTVSQPRSQASSLTPSHDPLANALSALASTRSMLRAGTSASGAGSVAGSSSAAEPAAGRPAASASESTPQLVAPPPSRLPTMDAGGLVQAGAAAGGVAHQSDVSLLDSTEPRLEATVSMGATPIPAAPGPAPPAGGAVDVDLTPVAVGRPSERSVAGVVPAPSAASLAVVGGAASQASLAEGAAAPLAGSQRSESGLESASVSGASAAAGAAGILLVESVASETMPDDPARVSAPSAGADFAFAGAQ